MSHRVLASSILTATLHSVISSYGWYLLIELIIFLLYYYAHPVINEK